MRKLICVTMCVLILLSAFSCIFISGAEGFTTPIIKIGDNTANTKSGAGEFETDPIPFEGAEDISSATVNGVKAKYYTGKKITQNVSVVLGGKTLKENNEYSVSYKNNVKVGTAVLTISGEGKCYGVITKKFLINLSKPKVKVTNGTYSIKLSWAKVPGAKQYGVYQYNTKTGEYKGIATTSSTSYLIKNKAAGTSYYFLVRAINGNNKSPCTTADNVKALTLCKAPGVKAAVSGKTVVLKITKPIGAKYFRVYKYNASTKKYTTLVSKTTATSVKLASQPKGTNYYLVRAFNANNAGSAFTTKNLTKAIVK